MFFKSDKQISIDKKLHEAIEGSIESLEFWIDNGADLGSTIDECTPIMTAADKGKWDHVFKIAEKRKENGNYGYIYALNEAIIRGQNIAAVALITAKAELGVEVFHKKRWTVLHTAIYEGNLPIIELILKVRPDLLTKELIFIPSPMLLAAKMLIENKHNQGKVKQHLDVLRFLFDVAKAQMDKEIFGINWISRYGFNEALYYLAKAGSKEMIQRFDSIGVPLDIRFGNSSIVHLAAEYKYLEIAEYALCRHPELENTKYYFGGRNSKTPREIDEKLIDTAHIWLHAVSVYTNKSLLLLRALFSPGSNFSCTGRDVCAVFILKLLLVMSQELKLDIDKNSSKNEYNPELIEDRMIHAIAARPR